MTFRISSVLKILYPDAVKHNDYSKTLTSVAFAGTIVGMLIFGYISDKIGRKFGMVRTTSAFAANDVKLKKGLHLPDGCYWNRCFLFGPLGGVGGCSPQCQRPPGYALCMPVSLPMGPPHPSQLIQFCG